MQMQRCIKVTHTSMTGVDIPQAVVTSSALLLFVPFTFLLISCMNFKTSLSASEFSFLWAREFLPHCFRNKYCHLRHK